MRKQFFKEALLAVALAAFSSTAAMGQSSSSAEPEQEQGKKKTELAWLKDIADRVSLHGYAQGGFNYTHQNGEDKGTFELKRTLFWVDAQITDRWSFLFMHDFSSVVQEYYTDYSSSYLAAASVSPFPTQRGKNLH